MKTIKEYEEKAEIETTPCNDCGMPNHDGDCEKLHCWQCGNYHVAGCEN